MIQLQEKKTQTKTLLNPRIGKTSACRKNTDGIVRTQTFRINDLPFDYAVPMLTGWRGGSGRRCLQTALVSLP